MLQRAAKSEGDGESANVRGRVCKDSDDLKLQLGNGDYKLLHWVTLYLLKFLSTQNIRMGPYREAGALHMSLIKLK